MKRVDRIYHHPVFLEELEAIREAERDRVFCGHGLEHLLDVARLAWIYNLEEGLSLDKELVFAAAFLHDIGRARQYTQGVPHEKAGAELAETILTDCGFQADERREILEAISGHRKESTDLGGTLREVLYRADKRSRACYACKAVGECNWPDDKKNKEIMN